ncbi:MAG: peptidoglycan editing factor PgeF [Acidovorax sp.]|nr:MAG: peptidoglycan editing factor PgeF [Acidovorax sp.]
MTSTAPVNPDNVPADWLVPDWPLPAGVHALCSTRAGGVSLPPYDSLNLGTHVGDDPAAVRTNRLRLQDRVQAVSAGTRPVFLHQVHGDGVAHLDIDTPDGTEADACVASSADVACAIMVADCLPVLLAHRSGAVVAAAHAGWRGLAGTDGQGVLESVFKRFEALALDSKAHAAIKSIARPPEPVATDTLAWLGPCIGPAAFEVGPEVRAAFCDVSPAAQACFTPTGAPSKYLCDLAGLARLRLQALGITAIYGNDSTAPWCTLSNASRFFSHRRDSGVLGGSGRFAACIWRD